jgi:hypothetical protein
MDYSLKSRLTFFSMDSINIVTKRLEMLVWLTPWLYLLLECCHVD